MSKVAKNCIVKRSAVKSVIQQWIFYNKKMFSFELKGKRLKASEMKACLFDKQVNWQVRFFH